MEPGQVTSPPKVTQKGPHTMIPNPTLTRPGSLPLCGQCLGSSGDPGVPGSPDTHCGAGLTRSYEHAWPALVAKGPTFLTDSQPLSSRPSRSEAASGRRLSCSAGDVHPWEPLGGLAAGANLNSEGHRKAIGCLPRGRGPKESLENRKRYQWWGRGGQRGRRLSGNHAWLGCGTGLGLLQVGGYSSIWNLSFLYKMWK